MLNMITVLEEFESGNDLHGARDYPPQREEGRLRDQEKTRSDLSRAVGVVWPKE